MLTVGGVSEIGPKFPRISVDEAWGRLLQLAWCPNLTMGGDIVCHRQDTILARTGARGIPPNP